MRAIEGVILGVTRKIGPKDEHFRILIFALWALQATSSGVPWLQNAVLGKSLASQRCCLKSPVRMLPEVPSKNFGRRALVQFGRSPRTRCSKRLLGCVVWIIAMTAQLPAHSHRRACEAATLQTKIIALVTAQLIGLHADCLLPVC
jgi:hypothetical protein